MKRLLKRLLLVLPVGILIVAVNYFFDPAMLFWRARDIGQIADMLVDGNNVEGVVNTNERLLMKEYIQKQEKTPYAIALGSSKTQGLSAEIAGEKDFFNHSIPCGNMGDYFGILGCYLKEGELPQKVIIGADPWIFNAADPEKRYESLAEEISYFTSEASITWKSDMAKAQLFSVNQMKQLVSLTYFQSALQQIGRSYQGNEIAVTDDWLNDKNVIRVDGSRGQPEKERVRTVDEVSATIQPGLPNGLYQLEAYQELDPAATGAFEQMIVFLQSQGVEVEIFLPPYHPKTYEFILELDRYVMIPQAESYIRKLADNYGITVYGSYDPENVGCQEDDYIDIHHLKNESFGDAFVQASKG